MTRRYAGSLIRAVPVVPAAGVASGVWTLGEQSQYVGLLTWPGKGTLTRTFLTEANGDNTDISSFTMSSVSLGDADATRHIVVAARLINGNGSTAVTQTCTVGGVSATEVVTIGWLPSATYHRNSIFIAKVPSGTTGDIVLTYTGATIRRQGVGVWKILGSTIIDLLDTATSTDLATATMALDVKAGGVVVNYVYAGSTPAMAFTNLTEDFETTIEGTADHAGAAGDISTDETGRDFTATITAGAEETCCCASFR